MQSERSETEHRSRSKWAKERNGRVFRLSDKLESAASNPALVISMTYLQDHFRSFFGRLQNFATPPGFDGQTPLFALTGFDQA